MPNLKNLKPFQKGQSGNPNGRPPIVKELKSFLQERLSETDPQQAGKNNLETISGKLFQMAQQGNLKAIELIFAYAFGKSKEGFNETGDGFLVIKPKSISKS